MFGFAVCVHSFLKDILVQLFLNEPVGQVPERDMEVVAEAGVLVEARGPGDGGAGLAGVAQEPAGDDMQAWRRERANSWKQATSWMQTDWFPEFWITRASLQPQVSLMTLTLLEIGARHEVSQLGSFLRLGTRRSRINDVLARRNIQKMFGGAREVLCAGSFWSVLPPTEETRSSIFRQCVLASVSETPSLKNTSVSTPRLTTSSAKTPMRPCQLARPCLSQTRARQSKGILATQGSCLDKSLRNNMLLQT